MKEHPYLAGLSVVSVALAIYAFAAVLVFWSQPSRADGVSSVVSAALSDGRISREDARRIYLLEERAWADGTKVKVYRLENERTHAAFVRDVLGMNADEFAQRWDRLVNAGLAPNIGVVKSEGDMIATIGRKHNAVGYLSNGYIVLNMRGHDAKIIKVDN
jgi:ABC-type phosphate transport system substrate-binding protein